MADTPDLADTIAAEAAAPAASAGDGQSATGRPLGDLIKADQYLAQKRASARKVLKGVQIVQLVTPAALDDSGRGAAGGFGSLGGM